MDESVRKRFIKIANMMHDENEAVALQAMKRCNDILKTHGLLWSSLIGEVQVQKTSNGFDFSDFWNMNSKEYPQQKRNARTQQKPRKRNQRVEGNNIPEFVSGPVSISARYDGTSRGKKSFVDIYVIDKGDMLNITYGPIRIFDENTMSSLDDLVENVESPTEYTFQVKQSKNPYPPTGKFI